MKRLAFSDDMMRALAAGEKTMTRRAEKRLDPAWTAHAYGPEGDLPAVLRGVHMGLSRTLHPRLAPGEHVASTCAFKRQFGDTGPEWAEYRFRDVDDCVLPWSPGRIMPARLAPFVLRITDVRAERLGDISDDDAVREGMMHWARKIHVTGVDPRMVFAEYWDRLYGKWAFARDRDVWVWVYGFEVAERRI